MAVVNLIHRWYCRSEGWRRGLQGQLMPWALEGIELGDDLLEIGPGPGLSTDWLRTRVARLTAIEIDQALAASLRERMAETNARVELGDATAMPFADGSFSVAVCFTMLHHVPSPALQDRLFVEACRVLRPGGVFAGSDSIPNLRWNLFHLFDTRVPVDPNTLAGRLEAAGFEHIDVRAVRSTSRFRARKPF